MLGSLNFNKILLGKSQFPVLAFNFDFNKSLLLCELQDHHHSMENRVVPLIQSYCRDQETEMNGGDKSDAGTTLTNL